MTTAAMVVGIVPLILATGAGAQSRLAIGLTIFFGIDDRHDVRAERTAPWSLPSWRATTPPGWRASERGPRPPGARSATAEG